MKKISTDDKDIVDESEIEDTKGDSEEIDTSGFVPPDENAVSIYDPYKRYIQEIRTIPILSREEEQKLAKQFYEKGDKNAARTLIISNLRLVVKIAMEFHRKWIKNVSDLIQEGNIGLMEALKRYNPYKNVRFSSYSSYWIRAYIIKFIMENYSLIKIGKTQAQRKLFFRLKKEKSRLEKLGYTVGPKLLAEKLDVKEKDIREMEDRLSSPILSLDEPVREHANARHIDSMSYDEESIENKMVQDELKDLFKKKLDLFKDGLNPNERFIFENRLYSENPMNLRELGEALDFSRERARQIEGKVMEKLKLFLKEHIPEYEIPE